MISVTVLAEKLLINKLCNTTTFTKCVNQYPISTELPKLLMKIEHVGRYSLLGANLLLPVDVAAVSLMIVAAATAAGDVICRFPPFLVLLLEPRVGTVKVNSYIYGIS